MSREDWNVEVSDLQTGKIIEAKSFSNYAAARKLIVESIAQTPKVHVRVMLPIDPDAQDLEDFQKFNIKPFV